MSAFSLEEADGVLLAETDVGAKSAAEVRPSSHGWCVVMLVHCDNADGTDRLVEDGRPVPAA